MGRVLHAPPAVLQQQLGLNDQQLAQVQKIRTNYKTKRIKAKAEAQLLRLKRRELMQKELPDVGQVLTVMRKMRAIRGRIAEERVKAQIKILRLMTKEQRQKLRAVGPGMGWGGKGWGRGGRGWGRGKGWGRGHGPCRWGGPGRGGRGRGGPGGW